MVDTYCLNKTVNDVFGCHIKNGSIYNIHVAFDIFDEILCLLLDFLIIFHNLKSNTVLQNQVYPKNNAPGVSKPPRVAKSDFLLTLKIFLTLDDIRPNN